MTSEALRARYLKWLEEKGGSFTADDMCQFLAAERASEVDACHREVLCESHRVMDSKEIATGKKATCLAMLGRLAT